MRKIVFDAINRHLQIDLDWCNQEGKLRRITLEYIDVTLFRSLSDPYRGLPGPHGYGDWGYDEVDISDKGILEHRILFSTGIEFSILFDDFKLVWEDTAIEW